MLLQNDNNLESRPKNCEKCGQELVYKGLGTYQCVHCKHVMQDDYGKVRSFLEKNPGATFPQVLEATGVSKQSMRQMLNEERIQIKPEK